MDQPPSPSSSVPSSPINKSDLPLLRLDSPIKKSTTSTSSVNRRRTSSGGNSSSPLNLKMPTSYKNKSTTTTNNLNNINNRGGVGGGEGSSSGGRNSPTNTSTSSYNTASKSLRSDANLTPRERKAAGVNNSGGGLNQFRSSNSLKSITTTSTASPNSISRGSKGKNVLSNNNGNLKGGGGKYRYSDAAEDDDDEIDLLLGGNVRSSKGGKSSRSNGTRESDGEFDEGWTGNLPEEDEQISALESRSRSALNPLRNSFPATPNPALKGKDLSRTIRFNQPDKKSKYPANLVRNQKYNILTFLPIVLYEQFKFFFNLYFLLVALSQFVPALRIGFLATYVVPLAFVLAITIGKEAYDDYTRYLRDVSANSTLYQLLTPLSHSGHSHHASSSLLEEASSTSLQTQLVPSSKLKVGDLVLLEKNERVPADLLLLRTSDPSGTCFVRTDQLDGETDWKLRVSVEGTQGLLNENELLKIEGNLWCEKPTKDIHTFVGTIELRSLPAQIGTTMPMDEDEEEDILANTTTSTPIRPLTAENMLWANTVLAAGTVVGCVVYTGKETRAVMNTSQPGTKTGLLDLEINRLAKILCAVTFALSVILVALNGFRGMWYIYVFRFLILFSSIIPISLRVNLDMGKTVYARQIQHDPEIPGTIVRTSTLPEELGRIEYLLTDKTGTLTQNGKSRSLNQFQESADIVSAAEMELKKLHLGTMSYAVDSMDEVAHQLATALGVNPLDSAINTMPGGRKSSMPTGVSLATRGRRDMSSRVKDVVLALGLCHNVTPVIDDDGSITYQASSPDEVAIVRWTESVGLTLSARDRTSMSLLTTAGQTLSFDILEVFPFTSESKRMGIVIRDRQTGEINFFQKGADVVMAKIVAYNDWLEEECGNMAREGLRTLVMARKRLSEETWVEFEEKYREARVSLGDRNENVARVISEVLEKDLELLGVTGVEDKLQDDVKGTIELLRNAGIKIWMLTGDKIETATCIAISTKLVARNQYIHQISKLKSPADARDELEFLQTKLDCCLVIDGDSLQLYIEHFRDEFISLTTKLSAVVACRCSPTQKADVARLIRAHTKKRVCCIGDGGNDVSMIQAADVGVGIVGKEGRQASLAADFSINQFSYLTKLLVWHGRNSYKRSAKLAQFVIHRGLIISVIQAVFSSVFYFSPIAIYQGWLMVGYATAYTMLPVFSLVLDRDVNEDVALLYPELYKELTKGRSLSYKTFFTWCIISVYQGGAIMIASLVLFESEFINIVSISFTALVINELIMVAVEVQTWHTLMILSEVFTLALYVISIMFLPEYFDLNFVLSGPFFWKVGIIVGLSAVPLWGIKVLKSRFSPSQYSKLRDFS